MFCVIQKWSRRVATMLPWLVIPLILLWAVSQLLPPAFRFEITSPRLACVFVLLVTLFWYEVLMPQLSAWRVRRNARLRERKRNEALELQKLKKTATRKPVLDLPVPPGISNSGIIKDFFGKGGKVLNGKPWSDNVSLCNQEWLENGTWVVNGPLPVKPSFPPRNNGAGFFSRNESCLTEKSYSGSYFFSCKLLTSFLLSIRWLWRKLFRINSSEDSSSDAEHRGMMSRKGENGGTGNESRGEKARRKAEEKRQARIEKELLEEEERKQREEVARLVEERRKLRDEKLEAENRAKGTSSLREKDNKREAEKRRQERRKEKDKGSSKATLMWMSWKRNQERKMTGNEMLKERMRLIEGSRRSLGLTVRGNVGTRYLERVRGTFLSSSKALSGSGFFGKTAPSPVPASKEVKPNSSVEYSSVSGSKRDSMPPERLPGKTMMNADDKCTTRPDSFFPSVSDMPRDILLDEPEHFEDPCYEPDPSMFPLLWNSTRPSPIESPLSRMRVAEEKPNNPSHFSSSPRALDMHSFPASDINEINDKGTWHMWNSSPLGPDGLSLVGGSANWITPLERSRLNSEDMKHQSPQQTMTSLFTNEGHITSGTHSPHSVHAQSFSAFGVPIPSCNDQDQWMQKAFFPPLCSSESNLPISPTEKSSEKGAAVNSLDPSIASWSK
ncbi:Reticulocyte-binding protein 2-like protein a [Bienertia sinuspersici]